MIRARAVTPAAAASGRAAPLEPGRGGRALPREAVRPGRGLPRPVPGRTGPQALAPTAAGPRDGDPARGGYDVDRPSAPVELPAPTGSPEDRETQRSAAFIARRVTLALFVGSLTYICLFALLPGTVLPLLWPASGVLAGVTLGVSPSLRRALLLLGAAGIAIAYVAHGLAPGTAVWFALVCAAEASVVRMLLCGRRCDEVPTLHDEGDVSRTIAAVGLGSAFGAAGHAAPLLANGDHHGAMFFIAVWGAHAASLTVLLPLFMRTHTFPTIATPPERVMQWILVLGTTGLVATLSDAPPLLFIVMPMFAWLGYRSTLREATWLLIGAAIITTAVTATGRGPVVALGELYDLEPALVSGYLQLFLLDCGLILLPLAVTVAQQRRAAAEAEAGRDTLERLLDSATSTAIVATDASGRVVVFNPGAEAMLGYDADEVLGAFPDEFHPPGELLRLGRELGTPPVFSAIVAAIASSEETRRLWAFRRRDGSRGTMLMSVAALPAEPEGAGGFLCTAEDVTEREARQAAMEATLEHQEAAVKRLEELDRIRSDFVSTVSHELRTPITSIIGYSEMLQEAGFEDLPPDHRVAFDRIAGNSRRLLTLIEDLLTASQVQTAQLAAIKEPCDLRTTVRSAVDAAADVVSDRGDLDLEICLPPHPVPFLGDPAQLERMVLNLLTNAIKFTPRGGSVCVRVVVSLAGVRVVVQDTGVGIPEEEQDRLFTRFFRSSTAARMAIQGTGLGLTIVKAIAELHGGEVDVVSAAGEGTTVSVWLPHAASDAPSGG